MFGRILTSAISEGLPRASLRRSALWNPSAGQAVVQARSYVTKLLMPALSPTMTDGKISNWLVKEGEKFAAGDALYEMETDKATMEVEASDDGILAKILVSAGSDPRPVSTVVALVGVEGEDLSNLDAMAAADEPVSAVNSESEKEATSDHAKQAEPTPGSPSTRPLLPSVKLLLQQYGVDASLVPASGPKGHLLKGDVLEYVSKMKTQPQPTEAARPAVATSPSPAPVSVSTPTLSADRPFVDIELSNMRKIIATRLTESKQTVPHSYVAVEVCVDNIAKLRNQLKANGQKASVNDFIVKAAARALKSVPEVNVQMVDGKAKANNSIDISVAVATPTGLITPIVPGADGLSVVDISAAMKDLGTRAKANKLKPQEYQGGSFTVSNLGMFGIAEFSAVINPPQAAIMAVGTSQAVAVSQGQEDDQTVDFANYLVAQVSYDERIVNAADMGRFLAAFKSNMEQPIMMV